MPFANGRLGIHEVQEPKVYREPRARRANRHAFELRDGRVSGLMCPAECLGVEGTERIAMPILQCGPPIGIEQISLVKNRVRERPDLLAHGGASTSASKNSAIARVAASPPLSPCHRLRTRPVRR